jgi:hypothetical protein
MALQNDLSCFLKEINDYPPGRREMAYYLTEIYEADWLCDSAIGLKHLSAMPRVLHHLFFMRQLRM